MNTSVNTRPFAGGVFAFRRIAVDLLADAIGRATPRDKVDIRMTLNGIYQQRSVDFLESIGVDSGEMYPKLGRDRLFMGGHFSGAFSAHVMDGEPRPQLYPGAQVLDLGGGMGLVALALLAMVGPVIHIHSLDNNHALRHYLRLIQKDLQANNLAAYADCIRPVAGSITQLEALSQANGTVLSGPRSYFLITALDTLKFVEPEKIHGILKQAFELLAPGGMLLAYDCSYGDEFDPLDQAYATLQAQGFFTGAEITLQSESLIAGGGVLPTRRLAIRRTL